MRLDSRPSFTIIVGIEITVILALISVITYLLRTPQSVTSPQQPPILPPEQSTRLIGPPSLAVFPFTKEEAWEHQRVWAEHNGQKVEETNSIGMKLVFIPPGEFTMGSPRSEIGRDENETEISVKLSCGFFLGKYEVTQGQWATVMETKPWKGRKFVCEGDDYPATYVGWEDALAFCEQLSKMESKQYRLPEEAEWEFACRGGARTQYSFGQDANTLSNFCWWGGFLGDGNTKDSQYAHQIGQKPPNVFGLHDVHGNVWEWCWARGDESTKRINHGDPQMNSLNPSWALRGGSWYDRATFCRSAKRDTNISSAGNDCRGFRIVLNLPGNVQSDKENFAVKTQPNLGRTSQTTESKKYKREQLSQISNSADRRVGIGPKPRSLAVTPFDQEQAWLQQHDWAEYYGVNIEGINSVGMKFVFLPPGRFTMGSSSLAFNARQADENEVDVQISEAFWFAQHEVTQGEWEAVMHTSPWKGQSNVKVGSHYPATCVNWFDAIDFCRKMSVQENKQYRLPTEAEWEYACRGGAITEYSFGAEATQLKDYAWYSNGDNDTESYAHQVGKKLPNSFGLYDMHGNVWEWCSDCYAERLISGRDPQGPSEGSCRVVRGGSWGSVASRCRSAFRYRRKPDSSNNGLGFRVVIDLSGT